MISVMIVVVIVVSSVWVYLDATKHKIGKIAGGKGLFNMSAGAWGVVTLWLWLIGFPAYLIKRNDLIERANEHPVEVKARAFKTIVFVILGIPWILLAVDNNIVAHANLPECDSAKVKPIIENLANENPVAKKLKIVFVELKNITQQSFDQKTQRRLCTATLVTTGGKGSLQYDITWRDENKGLFYVRTNLKAK